MIQRIQTLFLLFASGAAFGALSVPFASGSGSGLFADGVYMANDHIALIVCFAVAGALTLAAVFLYKTRKVQIRLATFSAIATLAAVGFGGWLYWNSGAAATGWTFWLGLPAVGVILALLARFYTQKDENLVRSMDRLR
ncbi:MAG: DUF4293 domain-containing protein [Saprospiraceae bacterium]|nr:DUF4293 domain-containing protein [Saprospiraceae bacterium]